MAFDKKLFLDFEGLSQYDELLKKYIQGEAVESTNKALEELAALGAVVESNKAALEVLNGEGEGSVTKAVNDAISALVDNAPEALDTLKELADWIADDTTASATLVSRVTANENAIAELEQADEDMKAYVATQDEKVYDSIQSVNALKIASLFPVKQDAEVSAVEAIDALEAGEAVELLPGQEITENIVISKSCFIDANGSTFAGTVTVPADADVVIENATFANPVVVA